VIFVDTSFLYPLFSAQDRDHERVRAVLEEYRGRESRHLFLTTNHVVSETITLIRVTAPRNHAAAVKVGELLYSGRLARVHWATKEEELAAFDYFRRYHDKEYSFVDCLAFVVMEKLGISEALAVDSDFTHRFIARPGPG
jgi:uncharacterized protein